MPVTQRLFRDEADKLAMASLSVAFAQDNLHITDLPYRLSSWALDDPLNACLWEQEDSTLVAWAVLQTPFWSIDFALHPAHEALIPQMLAWAEQRTSQVAGTRFEIPSWFINLFSDQHERIRQVEAAGFACQSEVGEDSWSKVWLRRPGGLPVGSYRLPQGFTIRPLAGECEAEAYTALQRTVFGTQNMTAAWRERTLRHPAYQPGLDIVVQAPSGQLAAFCIGWLGPDGAGGWRGQIEPLGCHPQFTRYALGRLALAEVLRRFQGLDVPVVYVETDNYRDTAFRLYESLGFEVIRQVLVFHKDAASKGE